MTVDGLLIALSVFMLGLIAGQDLLARHRRRAPRRALERAKPEAIARSNKAS